MDDGDSLPLQLFDVNGPLLLGAGDELAVVAVVAADSQLKPVAAVAVETAARNADGRLLPVVMTAL